MLKHFSFLCLFIVAATILSAQKDPVLFTVENQPVHVSEFDYIYQKTNGEKADYSQKSLDEYLDLYVKFKLKVQRAKEMQLDTIPSLMKELAGYRRQLANSYLVDKEVTARLVDEAYQRSQEEIELSHIMVLIPQKSAPSDTLNAYTKIMNAKKALDGGKSFGEVAQQYSEDENSKIKDGRLGYFVAMFRPGFYELENAAYNLKKGQYSNPIRTPAGYHIIKVLNKRPARGEVEAAHILIRSPKEGDDKMAKTRIDSIYTALQKGSEFEALAKAVSQHKQTAEKGGFIGPVSTNSPVEDSFKDEIFGLKKDGDYSKPFKSSVGWHVVKRISKKAPEAEDIAKRRLQTKIQNNAKGRSGKSTRQELAKQAMINTIKKSGNFTENKATYNAVMATIDSSFTTHKWKKDLTNTNTLFAFGNDMSFTAADFNEFSKRSSTRFRMGKNANPKEVAQVIYNEFVNDSALKYEESQLEKKYPEFKSLMREYEEGILLFEATKLQVWDKASTDSIGLAQFHNQNKGKYRWKDRAVVDVYTVRGNNEQLIPEIIKAASSGKTDTELLSQFNPGEKQVLGIQEKTIERGRDANLDKLTWKKGATTPALKDKRKKATTFMIIKEVKLPGIKTLDEARGYVIADYQDFLEKKWLDELKSSYKVDVDDKVLKSLVK